MNSVKKFSLIPRIGYTAKGFRRLSSVSKRSLVSVSTDQRTNTATLTLERPPVNSLNAEIMHGITSSIKDMESKKVRGVVLTSPYRTFCAGLDISELYNPDPGRFRTMMKSFREMCKTLYLTPMFTIAAVNGHALAGGCVMALSCDYRIMVNSDLAIGIQGIQLGIAVPKWVQALLINNIGPRQTEKSLCLGLLYNATEARSLNLVDEVAVDHEDLQAKIQQSVETWLKIPDEARYKTKMDLRKRLVEDMENFEDQEIEEFYNMLKAETTQMVLGKFIEKLKSKHPKS